MSDTWPQNVLSHLSWISNISRHHISYLYYKVDFCLVFNCGSIERIEPKVSCTLGKPTITELQLQPLCDFMPQEIDLEEQYFAQELKSMTSTKFQFLSYLCDIPPPYS